MKAFAIISTIGIYGFLLAQIGAVDPALTAALGSLGTAAILAWYLWYDTRYGRPAALLSAEKRQAELIAAHVAAEEQTRRTFGEIIDRMRDTFISEQNAVRLAFATDQTATRSEFAKESAEFRAMLMTTITSMRTAVHDVKDTAQVLLNKKALVDQKE